MIKKTFAFISVFVITLAFAACGSDNKNSDSSTNSTPDASVVSTPEASAKVETYDTGKFTVSVPDGWLLVPTSDMFDDYDGDYDPTSVTLVKDGKNEFDSFDHAYIRINLYDKGGLFSAKSFYNDVEDLDPMTLSEFECTAYSCTSADYPYIIIEGTNDSNDILFSILTENKKSSVELSDNDVQTILNSIKVK